MGRVLLKTVILLLWTGIALAANVAKDQGKPILSLNEQVFEVAEVKEGDVIEHAFKVINKGDQPLEIKKVKPT